MRLSARVLERLGIGGEALSPPMLSDLQRACGRCKQWRRCKRWLNSKQRRDSYRLFCPNAATLDALRRRETQHAGETWARSRIG